MLHGLAGTGAVVLLLIAAIPERSDAAAALAVFAPMSVVSMAGCRAAFGWAAARGPAAAVLAPALGSFGIAFGLWYAGIA